MSGRVVIVGAGHGGVAAAAALRQSGFCGEVVLFGDEDAIPYQRPPLSKAWLKREVDATSLHLRPEAFYRDQAIRLERNRRVLAIDPDRKEASLSGGETIAFDKLILATGCRARIPNIPNIDAANVCTLRSIVDGDRLAARIAPGRHVVIVGGGYVGLEVAASARSLGASVTVIEREQRLLARVTCGPLSTFFERLHHAHGVAFRFGVTLVSLAGSDRVHTVATSDGESIACDLVVIGVGAAPAVEIARAAGLAIGDGVVVDDDARTSAPDVYAIGDVADRPFPLYDNSRGRLESVPNALEQARVAAAHICGRPRPAPEVPWFWSDQYDTKLQIAGLPIDAPDLIVRQGSSDSSFAVYHLHADRRVRAVEAVNAPADFAAGKLLIHSAAPIDPAVLADASIPIKSLLVRDSKAA